MAITQIIQQPSQQNQKQATLQLPSDIIQEQMKKNIYSQPTSDQIHDLLKENSEMRKQLQKYSTNAKEVKSLKTKLEKQLEEMEQFRETQDKKYQDKHAAKLQEIEANYNYQYSKFILQINDLTDSAFTDLGHAIDHLLSQYTSVKQQYNKISDESKIQLQNQQLTNQMEKITIENQLKFNEIQSLKQQNQQLSQEILQFNSTRVLMNQQQNQLNAIFNHLLKQVDTSFGQIHSLQQNSKIYSSQLQVLEERNKKLDNFMIANKLVPEKRRSLKLRLRIIVFAIVFSVRVRKAGTEFMKCLKKETLNCYHVTVSSGTFQLKVQNYLSKFSSNPDFWVFLKECGVNFKIPCLIQTKAPQNDNVCQIVDIVSSLQNAKQMLESHKKNIDQDLISVQKKLKDKEQQLFDCQLKIEEYKHCVSQEKFGQVICQNEALNNQIVEINIQNDQFKQQLAENISLKQDLQEELENLQQFQVDLTKERGVSSDLLLKLKKLEQENRDLKGRNFDSLMKFQNTYKQEQDNQHEQKKMEIQTKVEESETMKLVRQYQEKQAARYSRVTQVCNQHQSQEVIDPITHPTLINELDLNYNANQQLIRDQQLNSLQRKYINHNGGRKVDDFDEKVKYVMDKTRLGQRILELIDL